MGYGRAMLVGAALAIVAIAVASVALIVIDPASLAAMRKPGDRLMVVIAGRDGQEEAQVAQLIGVVESSPTPVIRLVDPGIQSAVRGTSYGHLRDAYTFGGGEGVARAYAELKGERPMPVVSVTEGAFLAVVGRMGGIEVAIPSDANVFDGKQLFTFAAGKRRLPAADSLALLSSADYAGSETSAAAVRLAVADALVAGLRKSKPDLRPLLASGAIASTLDTEGLAAATDPLVPRLAEMRVVPSAR